MVPGDGEKGFELSREENLRPSIESTEGLIEEEYTESAGEISEQNSDPKPIVKNLEYLLEATNSIESGQTELLRAFQDLKKAFDSKIKYDSSKDKTIDSLHRELQNYRDDLQFKILRPIVTDLITLHDDFGKMIEYDSDRVDIADSESRLRRNLATVQHTIEEILARNGIEVFSIEGVSFNTRRQRSIKIVQTNDKDLDRLIAKRIRKGFVFNEKVLRPELVTTYKYVPDQEDQS